MPMIEYTRPPKRTAESKIKRHPKIDFGKRVIDFGDDLELFKIVSKLIMARVDLDGVDHDPGTGRSDLGELAALAEMHDLDAVAAGTADAPDTRPELPADDRRIPLSERFALRWAQRD